MRWKTRIMLRVLYASIPTFYLLFIPTNFMTDSNFTFANSTFANSKNSTCTHESRRLIEYLFDCENTTSHGGANGYLCAVFYMTLYSLTVTTPTADKMEDHIPEWISKITSYNNLIPQPQKEKNTKEKDNIFKIKQKLTSHKIIT